MLEQLYNGLLEDGDISISFEEFQNKFQNDSNYRQRVHSGIVEDGNFSGNYSSFENKFLGKTQGLTGDPTGGQNNTGSQLDDGSSESVSWFDQTWLGRGIAAASTTGEATSLMSENFSNISKESINDFIKAKEQEARSHVPSERMEKFQKQYIKEGKTWSAFFRGVRNQPGLLPELFVQSIGTQLGTLIDSPGASLAMAGTGAAGGAAVGAIPGAVAGFMGGLATSMEAALTFGELIETRLKEKNQEFTDENIKALLESEGTSIRNKALGRGLTIGAIEGFSGGLAGKAAVAAKQTVKGLKRSTLAAGAAGVGVEAVGGATGEIAGRAVAGQEMDAAEIGFEAITGTVTAPINVTTALLTAKKPTYKLNGEDVTYEQMKDFVDTADPVDIAKADIKMDDDYTGLGEKATQKQEIARKQVELSGDTDVVADVAEGFIENKIKTTIALAKQGKQIGSIKDAFAVENNEEAVKAYKELQDQYGKDIIGDQDVTDADGFFVPTPDGNVIIINKDVAKQTGQINVGGHELLHGVVQKHYENLDTKGKVDFIEGFKSTISKESLKYIQDIIDARNKDRVDKKTGKTIKGEGITSYSDEYLTIYSDGIVKGEITYNESLFTKFKNFLQDIFRKFGYNKEFGSGTATYNFMRDYNDTIKKSNEISKRALAVAGDTSVGVGGKLSKTITDAVDKLGKVDKDGNNLQEKGTGNFYYQAEADSIVKEIKEKGYLDNLIAAKYKADKVPKNFVSDVITALTPDIKSFKPEENNSLFGYLQGRITFRAGDVYNKIYKQKEEDKGSRDVGETTKEGDVKIQVAAEKSSEMEAFEEEDLSIRGQAKKNKAKKQRYSQLRQEMGFKREVLDKDGNVVEEGDKIHKEVLESAKKSLIMAYGATQNITDVQLRAKAVAEKIKKEYNNLSSPLFKQIKNFLTYGIAVNREIKGEKIIYLNQLERFRVAIVENVSTADLVQMQRNDTQEDKIFLNFVKQVTKTDEVIDLIKQERLPPSALNTITKNKKTGEGSNSVPLYDKIMPSPMELKSWADQPLVNPDTGRRSGLKGTRKDGIVKRVVNSLVTDAIMEARQSEEVQSKIAEMGIDPGSVAELGAAIGREVNVKFSKSNAVVDITAAIDGAGDVNVYSQIKFSKSHREVYEKQLTNRRPDLTEDQRKNAVQSVFDFVDGKEIPNNKKSKYEKMAMHYTANGFLILPEDGYKVIEAEKIATQKKLDPFSFKNPNVLIETYVGEVKGTRTNPDNVKTFTNKTELSNGVTVYDVEDSKQGQLDTRKVIDTHFGKKANPWCLCARSGDYLYTEEADTNAEKDSIVKKEKDKGNVVEVYKAGEGYEIIVKQQPDKVNELKSSFRLWNNYNKEGNGHQIAFQNGRLVSFRDGNEMKWWDRNDKPSNAVVVKGKKGKDGFKPVIEVGKTKETILAYEKVTGDKKNGTTIKKDLEGDVVFQETKKNGKLDGKRISFKKAGTIDTGSNDYSSMQTENYKDGSRLDFKEKRTYTNKKATVKTGFGRDEITLNNITKYEKSFQDSKDNIRLPDNEVTTIEGTVNQRYFKEFNDPSSITDGFVKTNLRDLTLAHERYYSMQGEKVEVVANLGIADKKLEDIQAGNSTTVTINGVEQETRVRFSKSAIDYKKAQNAVKFSKMSSEAKTKLSVKIGVMQRNISEEETLHQLLGVILDNITKFDTYQELINATVKDIKDIYNENEAVQIENVLVEGVFNESHVKKILDVDNKLYLKEVREIAVENELKTLGNRIKNLENEEQQGDEIVSFIKGKGRSIRSGQLKGITTNIKLFTQGVEKLLINDFLKENVIAYTFNGKDGRKKTGIKYKGEKIATFLHPSTIKKVTLSGNQTNIEETRAKTNKEASVNFEQMIKEFSDPKIKTWEKLASLELSFLDQMGPLRKSYPLGGYMVGKQHDSNNTTLEHNPPVVQVKEIWRQFIMGKIKAQDVRNWYADNKASVNVISNKLNDVLAAEGLSQKSNEGQNRYEHPNFVNHPDYKNFKFSKSLGSDFINKKHSKTLSNAVQFSRSANNPTKGITVLDFDDTLATSKSLIRFTRPDGTKGTLNAEQYASTYESLSELGYKFDFSEFTKVVDGKTAPLFNKAMKLQGKFGPENMFVLTARPAESAAAIHAFLKANGLNIPLKNITGLANSTSEAKALWIAEKVGEGYNDFYFADDALQNVQAVKNMLNQLDVKSKVQQARVKFSKTMNNTFNNILQEVTGIEAQKRFSAIKGRKRGDNKGKFRFFIPPSHEDFVGLLYNFMGQGRRGDAHRDFLEQALVRPLNRAYRELDTAKQAIANDYKKLNEQFPDVNEKLIKTTPDGDFTFQDAIRVYLWNKHGHKIPGLTETDQAKLTKLVESDPQLQAYAETLNVISKQEDYVAPGQAWETANIRIDLVDATGRVGRAQYLSEFIENADVLFSEENLNKIEAGYGKDFREALEDMLHRIKTGVNRPKGQSGKPNRFLNWLNASVAGVMFFNTRSALLQQLSNVNYLNFADNNILAAGKAFANQKQYWKDFAFILNSDMLKQRRGGIGTDVNGAELVEAIKKARPDSLFDQVAIITGKLLRLGFLPTQIGDNIAIATGGAAFYRNRVNTYLKQGLSQKEAEAKAFTDFQDITQSTQQSARPDMTSQQQASWIGKLVLNFLNTPSQYNRIIKKAGSDLKNRRITKPNTTQTQSDMSNLSRILYYGAAQNLIFYGLQTALFAVMFGTEDDDESEAFLKKKERVINGSIDTILRGSGIYGVAISTLKNMLIKFAEQREKGYNKDESAVIMEALNFSPVVGIRARKIVNAEKTLNYNTKVIDEMTTLDIDNPQWSAVTNYVEAITTLPTNRLYQKTINVRNALDNQYTAFQRAMFFSGYTTWSLDLGDTEKMKKIKEKVKSKKKSKSKSKFKPTQRVTF